MGGKAPWAVLQGALPQKVKKNHESKNNQPPGNGGLRNESNVPSPKK
jgi:hypothetical protein